MTNPSSALRIPESMGAAEIGPYMRELRDYFKLTPQEVSERLHIRVRYVNAIEEGRFELMPGKVYARGYIHTYAEFLGLDADQVVAQCFTTDAGTTNTAVATPVAFVPAMKFSQPSEMRSSPWRGFGIVIVVALLSLVAFTQFTATSEKSATPETSTVAPVPESMLASVRNVIMPTARNYDCLTDNWALSCFFANDQVQKISALQVDRALPFAIDIEPDAEAVTSPEKPTDGLIHDYLVPTPADERRDD